jgi:hypothetical protein
MIIGIDFDGTCVTHSYPLIGDDIGAVPVLKALVEEGHSLILWTMRSDNFLDAAVNWFDSKGIPLYGVNCNPTQHEWTNSPKAYCQLVIDDNMLCAPLVHHLCERPYIDWVAVKKELIRLGILIDTSSF